MRFTVGEHVQLVTPGWIWDGQIGEIRGAWEHMGRSVEPFYVVLVHWPGGHDRRYSVWESEVRPLASETSRNVP